MMTLIPYTNRISGNSNLAELLGWSAPLTSSQSSFRFHEDQNNYYAELDLPGVRKESLQLNVEGEELTLAAERSIGFGEEKRTISITRGLTVPDDVNVDGIRAAMADGVLTLTFPKKEESKPKQLKIEVS